MLVWVVQVVLGISHGQFSLLADVEKRRNNWGTGGSRDIEAGAIILPT
jgi:hypothetical protein